jgi:hypothetical protein
MRIPILEEKYRADAIAESAVKFMEDRNLWELSIYGYTLSIEDALHQVQDYLQCDNHSIAVAIIEALIALGGFEAPVPSWYADMQIGLSGNY